MDTFSDERFRFPYQTNLAEELAHLAYSAYRDPNHYRELQFEQIMHNFLREQGHEEEQIAKLTNTALSSYRHSSRQRGPHHKRAPQRLPHLSQRASRAGHYDSHLRKTLLNSL